MTWRPSATAASASTLAISWMPWPPMPVKITSRSGLAVGAAVIGYAVSLFGGERFVEQAVQRLRAGIAHHHRVADRFPAPALHARRHRHLAEQRLGFFAVVGLRIRVDLEVLHIETVVLLQPLVHHLRIARLGGEALTG